jgi:hypothetical protein
VVGGRFAFPPIAKCAMDGAPGRLGWWTDKGKNKRDRALAWFAEGDFEGVDGLAVADALELAV